jgi:hypothetical protein
VDTGAGFRVVIDRDDNVFAGPVRLLLARFKLEMRAGMPTVGGLRAEGNGHKLLGTAWMRLKQ